MVEPGSLSVAVLAAGSSRRFGAQDKLAAPFRGQMLGLHIARALSRLHFANRWVITSRPDHPCTAGWEDAGFSVCVNQQAGQGMGTSLAMAASLAIECAAEHLLVCLADMPLVEYEHIRSLVRHAASRDPDTVIATSNAGTAMPPAIFGAGILPQLARSSGDMGARNLLGAAALIPAPSGSLADIDTPETLRTLESRI